MLSSLFMSLVGRETLVAPDDTWSLLMVMCVAVAVSIYLEQKYMWASKISGAIIALLFALVLSNLSIIPTACTLYDDIKFCCQSCKVHAASDIGTGHDRCHT